MRDVCLIFSYNLFKVIILLSHLSATVIPAHSHPKLHILTLLTMCLHPMHMAHFSVNMRRRYGPEGGS